MHHYQKELRKLEKWRQMIAMEYPNIFSRGAFLVLLFISSLSALDVPTNFTYFGDAFLEGGYVWISVGEPHDGTPIYTFTDKHDDYWGLTNLETRIIETDEGVDIQKNSGIYVYGNMSYGKVPQETLWWKVLTHEIIHILQPTWSEQEVSAASGTDW